MTATTNPIFARAEIPSGIATIINFVLISQYYYITKTLNT